MKLRHAIIILDPGAPAVLGLEDQIQDVHILVCPPENDMRTPAHLYFVIHQWMVERGLYEPFDGEMDLVWQFDEFMNERRPFSKRWPSLWERCLGRAKAWLRQV